MAERRGVMAMRCVPLGAVILVLAAWAMALRPAAVCGAATQADDPEVQRALHQAQRAGAAALGPISDRRAFVVADADVARRDLEGSLAKHPRHPGMLMALARCLMVCGDYDSAAARCKEVLDAAPGHQDAKQTRQRALHLAGIANTVRNRLLAGQRVLQVQELRVPGEAGLWLALTGQARYERDVEGYLHLRLRLLRRGTSGLATVWLSDQLTGYAGQGGFPDTASFHVADVSGDGVPEVVVDEVFFGSHSEPSHLDVFAWRGHGLVKILGVSGDRPLEIRHINGDGRYEVLNRYTIGVWRDDEDQRLWSDIYVYRRGRYVLADHDFPNRFRHWPAQLRRETRKYPDDIEVWEYLGIAYQIRGEFSKARHAYRRALGARLVTPTERQDPQLRRQMHRDVRERMRDAARGVRSPRVMPVT